MPGTRVDDVRGLGEREASWQMLLPVLPRVLSGDTPGRARGWRRAARSESISFALPMAHGLGCRRDGAQTGDRQEHPGTQSQGNADACALTGLNVLAELGKILEERLWEMLRLRGAYAKY